MLEQNEMTRESIRHAIENGLPTIAECGGFQYLGHTLDGRKMCGVLPHDSTKTGKLVLIDYKTDSVRGDEWQNIKKAEERLTSRHRNQLEYYRKICSDLFEEEIPHGYIYSTVLGRCLEI